MWKIFLRRHIINSYFFFGLNYFFYMMTRNVHMHTKAESHTRCALKSKQSSQRDFEDKYKLRTFFLYSELFLWYCTHLYVIVELLYATYAPVCRVVVFLIIVFFNIYPQNKVALLHSATLKWILSVKREKAQSQFYYSELPDILCMSICFDIATVK